MHSQVIAGGVTMRFFEYLPWLVATLAGVVFVTAVTPSDWSSGKRNVFQLFVALSFFFAIGSYWLTTGEKFDETAYRLVLCPIFNLQRCTSSPTIHATPSESNPELLRRLRENDARREKELKETADAVVRLQAAQREQAKRAATDPQEAPALKERTPICMTFNGRQFCE
jgi:hypothetical protein